jgi:murein DD-endopeptidase MepM/ murein hydrolase activator NlpD
VPPHSAARHRRAVRPRHRAPLFSGNAQADEPSAGRNFVRSKRGRTVALTALLGTALAAGIAGGTAAAANARQHRATLTAPAPLVENRQPVQDVDAVPPEVLREMGGRAQALDPILASGRRADGIHRKSRPQPKIAAAGRAAWVNPNPTARVTSCFGPRWGRQHEGVDMAAPDGTPIVAAGAGVVVRAGVEQGYGNAVLIDHGDGWLTHYGHLSVITVVSGQRVTTGQQIGNEGSTGHSTGPHLHFEVHHGFYQNPVEPTAWMHAHGVDILGCAAF